jgi:hypothetical protein
MAISNLVTPGKKIDLPSVSMFFGGRSAGAANDNMQKVSSTLMSDSMVSAITDALKTFTSEIARLQETTTATVRSFVNIIKSLKELNKDIKFKFKALGTELNASRLDFVRNVLTNKNVPAPVQSSLATAFGETPATPQPDKRPEPPKPDEKPFDVLDALITALGIAGLAKGAIVKALGGLITLLATPAGALAFLTVAGGYLAYKGLSELTKAIMNDPDFKEMQERDRTKTELEMRREVVKRIAERNNPELRQQGYASREEALKSILKPDGKPLSPRDIKAATTNDKKEEVIILQDDIAKQLGFAAFNRVTGERYLNVETAVQGRFRGTPITSAPPAAASEAVRSAGDTGSSAATGAGAGAGGSDLNRVTDTVPATGGGGSAPTGTPTREGTPQRNSSTGGGEPLNTTTAQHWMLNHPDVAAAYAALNSADKQKAAEMALSGQESEARNFVLSRGSVPKTLPAQMLTGGAQTVRGLEPAPAAPASTPVPTAPPPPAETPAADKRASNEPVVINNNSSQSTAMTDGGEGNNIAGQNFAMFVTDPFLTEFLQKQNVPYA